MLLTLYIKELISASVQRLSWDRFTKLCYDNFRPWSNLGIHVDVYGLIFTLFKISYICGTFSVKCFDICSMEVKIQY